MEKKKLIDNPNKKNSSILRQTLRELLIRIIKISQCQSNSIRLEKNGDYPFFIQDKLPHFFVEKENSLLTNSKKNLENLESEKILDCMCGNVINGYFNPSFPFFTKNGSFWTNSSTNLLNNITQEQRKFIGNTRNMCNLSGYESIALFPLITTKKIIGLIHVADPREKMFTKKKLSQLESLSRYAASIINSTYDIADKLLKIDNII